MGQKFTQNFTSNVGWMNHLENLGVYGGTTKKDPHM
jgi:hypothetical protein